MDQQHSRLDIEVSNLAIDAERDFHFRLLRGENDFRKFMTEFGQIKAV
jgi:hypothetical protein